MNTTEPKPAPTPVSGPYDFITQRDMLRAAEICAKAAHDPLNAGRIAGVLLDASTILSNTCLRPCVQPAATPTAVDLALALADCEPINDAKSVHAGYYPPNPAPATASKPTSTGSFSQTLNGFVAPKPPATASKSAP